MAIVKDAMTIGKILATIITMFNLNSMQENALKSYVKLQQMEWIEKCKSEAEIQQYIISKANEIIKE